MTTLDTFKTDRQWTAGQLIGTIGQMCNALNGCRQHKSLLPSFTVCNCLNCVLCPRCAYIYIYVQVAEQWNLIQGS